ncbi:hypothetical protein ACFX13_048072 [Malus domestica]
MGRVTHLLELGLQLVEPELGLVELGGVAVDGVEGVVNWDREFFVFCHLCHLLDYPNPLQPLKENSKPLVTVTMTATQANKNSNICLMVCDSISIASSTSNASRLARLRMA